jgi:hypothetical protein
MATLIDAYENEHHPIDPPDPIGAIKFRMEQQGLTRKDLEGILGTRTRIAEVLNRRRGLSINMIRRLHEKTLFGQLGNLPSSWSKLQRFSGSGSTTGRRKSNVFAVHFRGTVNQALFARSLRRRSAVDDEPGAGHEARVVGG